MAAMASSKILLAGHISSYTTTFANSHQRSYSAAAKFPACKKIVIVRGSSSSSSSNNSEVEKESMQSEDDSELTAMPSTMSRRAMEKFAVRDTGKHQCRSCGYVYDQEVGDPAYPIPPGLQFSELPEDWRCSTCGAAKSYFNSISVEVAGFAENQTYGFGTNGLTSGQKSLLIYGSLIFGFLIFLSGYFLQ